MAYIGTCEAFREFLYETVDPDQPICLHEKSVRANAEYHGIFPGTLYCCFSDQSHGFFGDGDISITFRPGSASEGAKELYGSDLLQVFDDIAADPEANLLMPAVITVFDQSARGSWDSRKFAIGVDTECNEVGGNRFVLVPTNVPFWEEPTNARIDPMAWMR